MAAGEGLLFFFEKFLNTACNNMKATYKWVGGRLNPSIELAKLFAQ